MIGIALLIGLVVLAFGAGTFFLRRLPALEPLERFVFAVPLGMGVLSYTILALGLLRLAQPVPLTLGVVVVGLALGIPGYRSLRRREKKPAESASVLALVVALVLGLAGLCTLVGALAPPGALEWDTLSYHLAAPKRYLLEGRIYYIPDDHHSNFPFTLNMLYLWMLSLGSVAGAKLCHWLCGVLLVASVYAFCQRHLSKDAGLIAALVLATTPIVLWEAVTAYIDLALALFSWLSIYALINAFRTAEEGEAESGATGHWLRLSAALMGLALGTKSTALAFWGVALVGIVGRQLLLHRRWEPATLRHAVLWGTIALAIGAPWYLKTFAYTGDPVYPFGWRFFHGHYWSDAAATGYAADQAAFGFGKGPLQLLKAPWDVTLEAGLIPPGKQWVFTEYVAFGLSPVYLAVLIGLPLLANFRLPRAATYALLWGLVVTASWFFIMQQTRYLVPALPAFAVVAGWGLSQASKLPKAAGGLLVTAAALWGLYLAGTQLTAPPPLGNLETAERWINDNAPKDAKVALFDDTRGFYLDRPYLWAQPNHAPGLIPYSAYADADAFVADFKRRGYTYLLHNEQFAKDDDPQWQLWRGLLRDAIVSDKVELAQSFGAIKIYRLP